MNNLHNLQCLLSSGIGSPSRVVRFLKLSRHSNSVNNPNGPLINQVVIRPQPFVSVRASHSLAEQFSRQFSIPSTKSSSLLATKRSSPRSFSTPRSFSAVPSLASSHLLSPSSFVQRSVTRSQSSSMAPIIVNYQSYLEKLINDTRVLIFSKTTCPFCLKVSVFVHPLC